ncbi:GTP-binding protein Era [Dethiosulfovibrio peptidovorans DSM 11002]|uniref:GTPase Era n=1 Tax=Dethiosulfovibrio peptidovorans DSM 11002 TaxID=469381 RepID=D2Z2U3_9BACT|nr:GTPase Era [Dethiosulfovibrio peptidovorans]EFC92106.1 GTP-binding protein Era [Dethiosulfovibrio peptidovorans DSM 11002]
MTIEKFDEGYRSGVVAVVGRPNVGKSSLVNALLRCKATIVSPKPQTTRNRIRCIADVEGGQIVFTDTPGIHKPQHRLGEAIVDSALVALDDADLILYVISAQDEGITGQDRHIIERLKNSNTPVIMVINKVDLLGSKKAKILPLIDTYRKKLNPMDVLPVSAREDINLETLMDFILEHIPEGPPMYMEDMLIDRSSRFLAAEIIREQVLLRTDQEVPHSVAVEILEYKSPEEYPERRDTYIRGVIFVERRGQKLILLGSGGEKMKEIGTAAREALESFLGGKVFLDLWIKVRKDWRNSESEIRRLGYRE